MRRVQRMRRLRRAAAVAVDVAVAMGMAVAEPSGAAPRRNMLHHPASHIHRASLGPAAPRRAPPRSAAPCRGRAARAAACRAAPGRARATRDNAALPRGRLPRRVAGASGTRLRHAQCPRAPRQADGLTSTLLRARAPIAVCQVPTGVEKLLGARPTHPCHYGPRWRALGTQPKECRGRRRRPIGFHSANPQGRTAGARPGSWILSTRNVENVDR